jgi:steroid delta-isomerase-like uncharacterized protein
MSESDNTALVRRWFEDVWNTRREATVHELLDGAAVGHLEGLVTHGVAEFLAARAFILSAFPDFHITLEDTAAQDDKVAVRWSAEGTHNGEFLGVPATNTAVHFRGITWMRLSSGRIVDGWDVWNLGGLAAELQTLAQGRAKGAA